MAAVAERKNINTIDLPVNVFAQLLHCISGPLFSLVFSNLNLLRGLFVSYFR